MRRLLVRPRHVLAASMLVVGAVLLLVAGIQAAEIPARAHDDFGALIARQGVLSHPPDYPTVYRRISADSRLLRNAYLGAGGLVLLAAGSFGLVSAVPPRPADEHPPGRPPPDRSI